VEPLTRQESRMHITVSPAFLALLKKAKAGQGHAQPGATDEQVLTAALELLVAHQEKRKASVPAKVTREVRRRDGGKWQWKLESDGVCGSEVRTEIDHVVPRGRGGPSTVSNCRILCKAHNIEAAPLLLGPLGVELLEDVVHAGEGEGRISSLPLLAVSVEGFRRDRYSRASGLIAPRDRELVEAIGVVVGRIVANPEPTADSRRQDELRARVRDPRREGVAGGDRDRLRVGHPVARKDLGEKGHAR